MPVSQDVISDVLRHLGYPVHGLYQNAPAGGALAFGDIGFRFFGAPGSLLYRLNQLSPVEEAKITGQATGAVFFTGLNPRTGDSMTITLNASNLLAPIVVTVIVPATGLGQRPWSLAQVAAQIAQAFTLQPAFIAAGFYAIADYGVGPFSNAQVPVPVCSINAQVGVTTFTLTVTYTGTTVPQTYTTNCPPSPFIAFKSAGTLNKIYGYIPILNYLEGAYGGATIDLSLSRSNEVFLRMDELDVRDEQYNKYVDKFSYFIGIPRNPDAPGSKSNGPVYAVY